MAGARHRAVAPAVHGRELAVSGVWRVGDRLDDWAQSGDLRGEQSGGVLRRDAARPLDPPSGLAREERLVVLLLHRDRLKPDPAEDAARPHGILLNATTHTQGLR